MSEDSKADELLVESDRSNIPGEDAVNPAEAEKPKRAIVWMVASLLVGVAVGALVMYLIDAPVRAELHEATAMYGSAMREVEKARAERNVAQASAEEKQTALDSISTSVDSLDSDLSAIDESVADTADDGSTGEGTYLVGTDLAAGRYKGSPDGDVDAYWQISKDANGDKIIANDNAGGQFYVTVRKGQYLTINRATIRKVK